MNKKSIKNKKYRDLKIGKLNPDLINKLQEFANKNTTSEFYQEPDFVNYQACIYCKKIDCECSEQDLGFDFGAKG
jgi:hypothetical protein